MYDKKNKQKYLLGAWVWCMVMQKEPIMIWEDGIAERYNIISYAGTWFGHVESDTVDSIRMQEKYLPKWEPQPLDIFSMSQQLKMPTCRYMIGFPPSSKQNRSDSTFILISVIAGERLINFNRG